MEWMAGLESPRQELSRLRFGCRAIHRHPFGTQPSDPLETPVRVCLRNPPADSLVAEILE